MKLVKQSGVLSFYETNERWQIQVYINGHKWFTCIDHDIEKVIKAFNSIPSRFYY
jgi:hypothetical protein